MLLAGALRRETNLGSHKALWQKTTLTTNTQETTIRLMRSTLSIVPTILYGLVVYCMNGVLAEDCTVCSDLSTPVPDPEHPIYIPALSANDCDQLDRSMGFLAADHSACRLVRAIGPVCGCSHPENTCNMCPTGQVMTKPFEPLEDLSGADFLEAPNAETLTGITCEIAEAMMLSSVLETATQCNKLRDDLQVRCGCQIEGGDYNSTDDAVGDPPERQRSRQWWRPYWSPGGGGRCFFLQR